jgi:serine/threonine protein kinase
MDDNQKLGKILFNNYIIRKEFGKGSFGIVWLCEDSIFGKNYAIKEISVGRKIKKEIIEKEL